MKNIVISTLLFVCFLSSLNAYADGGYFYKATLSSGEVNMDAMGGQQAFLVKSDDAFTMYLQSSVQGNLDDFSWVLPLPAEPASVKEAPEDLFTFLNDMTGPRVVVYEVKKRDDGWCIMGGGSSDNSGEDDKDTLSTDGLDDLVKVVDSGVVGDFSYEIISSEQEDALIDWLDRNEYYLPDKAEEIIGEYIEDGFVFLAAKVRRDLDSGSQVNSLPAMKIEFSVDTEMIFPMKITSLSTQSKVPVLVYAAAKQEVPVLSSETEWNQVSMKESACDSKEFHYKTIDLLDENPDNIALQTREYLAKNYYSYKSDYYEDDYSYYGNHWSWYEYEDKLYYNNFDELYFKDYSAETGSLIKSMFEDGYVLCRWYTELSSKDMDEDIIVSMRMKNADNFSTVSRIKSVDNKYCGGGCQQVPEPFWALLLVLMIAALRGLRYRRLNRR